jgi:tRNA A37 N6-isopentenylltransferase MiaA
VSHTFDHTLVRMDTHDTYHHIDCICAERPVNKQRAIKHQQMDDTGGYAQVLFGVALSHFATR